MGENAEIYIDARREYERMRDAWLMHVRAVSGVAEGLRRPDVLFLLNTKWDLTGWPRNSTAAMKQARDSAIEIWSRLSLGQQAQLLKPPPSRLGDP